MNYSLFVFIITLSCAVGPKTRGAATIDRVLISHRGTQIEGEDIGKELGLKFVRKVLSKYEFELPSSVNLIELKKSHPELQFEKLNLQKRVKKAVTVNDAQWSNQWHLRTSQTPSMNVYNAWDKGFTGSGITLAIVDDGIDIDHSDLASNYNAALSYDIIFDSPDPSHYWTTDGHGTNCAGVAGGVKNSICVIGVAYQASIPAIRLLDALFGSTEAEEALALTHALSSIDIYSNSWGPSDDGNTFAELQSIQVEALQTGVTEGRDGKGVIYTWASGNGGYNADDCNADGYASSIYTIAIAAVSETTAPTWYSEHCTAILAATYSGDSPNADITTTGPANTCVNDFSGTSSACPVASGIIALTLQANPALTWRDIQHMIVEYSISTGLHSDASFYTNGAGKNVSHWFGFGLMDAEAMVDKAPSWLTVPPSISWSSTRINVYSTTVTTSITSTLYAPQGYIRYLEHVIVTISYQASWRGDVEFYLDSPSGTHSKIFQSRIYDSSSFAITWDFVSVHNWGEDPEGVWTLTMSDAYGGTRMTLNYWKIEFYGTVTDPLAGTPNDTFTTDSTTTTATVTSTVVETTTTNNTGTTASSVNTVITATTPATTKETTTTTATTTTTTPTIATADTTTVISATTTTAVEEEAETEPDNVAYTAGVVVGAVAGIALLVTVGLIAYKKLFVGTATAAVAPASYGYQ